MNSLLQATATQALWDSHVPSGMIPCTVADHAHMKLSTFGPAILITVIGFVIAWQFVNPAPPRQIRIATGSDQGAYYLFARRYREQLAQEGIELEILTTAGSLENLRLLVDDSAGVDLAFVQGGTAGAMDDNSLAGLASLFHEPLWVFYRGEQSIDHLTALDGSRLAIGKQDSGTQAVARSLLENNFIDTGAPGIHAIGDREAEQALLTAGCAQMHRFYGLPGGAAGGMADSKLPDMQTGWELAHILAKPQHDADLIGIHTHKEAKETDHNGNKRGQHAWQ